MPALQKKHKKSSVHNIKSVMNTRYGRSGGIRTHGIHIPNVARYQLRYTPIFPSSVFYSRARRFQAAPACGPRLRFTSGAAAVRTRRTRLCMYCLL